jgi:hypothetical protein
MDQSIAPGIVPPARGLEKEEPELAHEDDIPSDDGAESPSGDSPKREDRPLREIERE